MPPPGGLARGGRRDQARVLRRPGVLGPSPARVRGPGCTAVHPRARTGRPWRQPHRTHLHRRPVRGLALRGAAPGRLREPGAVRLARRRAHPDRLLHRGGGQVRAAGQQAHTAGAGQLPAVLRPGAGHPRRRRRDRVPRLLRLGRGAARAGSEGIRGPSEAEVRTPRGGRSRTVRPDRQLSREPAEHVHRQAHRADARRRIRPGEVGHSLSKPCTKRAPGKPEASSDAMAAATS